MTDPKLGPTGDFPEGKLGKDDEGGINMAIAASAKDGQVHIQFGGPVAWLAGRHGYSACRALSARRPS